MIVSIKEGAKLDGVKPEILFGFLVIESVYRKYGYDLVITEATGGQHMPDSLHYKGQALDIRTKTIPTQNLKESILGECKRALSSNYDIILESFGLENEHIHLEYQPK